MLLNGTRQTVSIFVPSNYDRSKTTNNLVGNYLEKNYTPDQQGAWDKNYTDIIINWSFRCPKGTPNL